MNTGSSNLSLRQKLVLRPLFVFALFLMGAGVDLYVPSLPTITRYFHSTSHAVQLTVALYMLGYAVGQIVLCTLSDSWGRRKILIGSAIFYVLISFLAAWAANIYLLIFYRFLQGIGIAGLGAVARTMISDCFVGVEFTKVVSTAAASWALGPILGPLIGGYLQHYFGWQANFYFFACYALVLLIYIIIMVPETHNQRLPLHPVRLAQTLMRIITNKAFILLAMIVSGLIYSILVVFNLIGPYLLQTVLHYSAVAYGHIALLLGATAFIGTMCNRFFVTIAEPLQISLIALIIALLISLIMVLLALFVGINSYTVLLPSIGLFFCCALVLPNIFSYSIGLFTDIAGTANALFGALMSAMVFLIGSIAAAFHVKTQLPMALLYSTMVFISLLTLCYCYRQQR
ncbi:MAG: multidrug effflux MFS transporter [Gammaproteobacteria bacterium]|nr:multidrug effflux MFS transporter [Gammaproteobacteria bacterium]